MALSLSGTVEMTSNEKNAQTQTFAVALDSIPSADVVVTCVRGTVASATVDGPFTFTPANAKTAQTATVTSVAAGTSTITCTAANTGTYAGTEAGSFTVTVEDPSISDVYQCQAAFTTCGVR